MQTIKRGINGGLLATEGEAWKKKRKILNRIFNFEMIKNMTEQIAEICDDAFQEVEASAKKTKYGNV